ncbi:MAG: DegV family protein [Clostridia bacterium]|nr:DegV family protein [Clostridia bacterium]
MTRIKISADSTCDLSCEILDKFNISIVPLTVVSDGNSYRDGVDITPEEVFRLTEENGKLFSTSAANIYDYTELFTEQLKNYDEVIHICISAEFSTCYRNACTAAEEFGGRVRVVDSRNLSTGMGHVVYEAALMAQSGKSSEEIEAALNKLTDKVEASFVVNSLEYLKRGGRCSALKAFGAAVLQLKPSINVVDGKMTVGDTYRGSFEKCLKRYVKDRLEGRDDIVDDRIFITYSSASPETVDMVRNTVKEYHDFKEIICTSAGCTISCHCGPDTLGILFMRK